MERETNHPETWKLAGRTVAFVAVAFTVASGAVLFFSEDAEATHYWAGTLQWNHTPKQDGILGAVDPNDLNLAFFSGRQSWRWSTSWGFNNAPACSLSSGEGVLEFTDGGTANFDLIITTTDSARDRAIARIVKVGSPASACTADPEDPTYHVAYQFDTPNQGPGSPHKVTWDLCCRIEYGSAAGNYHVNNHQGASGQSMHLESFVDMADPNRSPIVDLVPLQFCPIDAVCQFAIRATDPDGDRLTYRLSSSAESSGAGAFYQPGPLCVRCTTDMFPAVVYAHTGLVEWNTFGAEKVDTCAPSEPGCPSTGRRNLYSMQIMVEDGTTAVPVDFMIELLAPPEELCPDGSIPPVDDWTGEYDYERCERVGPDCNDPEMFSAPECQDDPTEHELPPGESPILREPWYAPEPPQDVSKPPALSGGDPYTYVAQDHIDERIANLDSDGDGIVDRLDACPATVGGQTDFDGDGLGDACDEDRDNDGKANAGDPCPLNADPACGLDDFEPSATGTDSAATVAAELESSAQPEREAENVHVAQPASKKSAAGAVMLVVLGAAVVVLLVAMGRKSQR